MMLKTAALTVILSATLLYGNSTASAHLVSKSNPKKNKLEHIAKSQEQNLAHSKYVCRNGRKNTKKWHCVWVGILQKEYKKTQNKMKPAQPVHDLDYWIGKQIWAGNIIGSSATIDPWPNCPDPYFNGST